MLGVGEEREIMKRKVWYAPAYLVNLNRYMKRHGVSSKLRTRAIRNYLEGKEPPPATIDAIAGYTEEQLSLR